MPQYTPFLSWQNDRKDTKAIIFAALNKAKEKFADEGIELVLDQDTRDRTGKRNIDAEVLQKIRHCDIFLADLTPVITYFPPKDKHELPEHIPNSNVMYEYGYAFHAKGDNRMIVLASLSKEDDEHIEYMPFDINHDTITLFSDVKSLGGLHQWISNIIKDVDKERSAQVPKYDCNLLFNTDEGFSTEITLKPLYKKICYKPKRNIENNGQMVGGVDLAVAASSMTKFQQVMKETYQIPTKAKLVAVKPLGDTTNLSFVPIRLVFFNKGTEALDNLKISILALDNRVTFAEENVKHAFPVIMPKGTDSISAGEFGVFQNANTLNPHDSIMFDEVFVRVPHDMGTFTLQWSLNSRQHQAVGELIFHVKPEYEYETIENDKLAHTEEVVDFLKEEQKQRFN